MMTNTLAPTIGDRIISLSYYLAMFAGGLAVAALTVAAASAAIGLVDFFDFG